MSSKRKPTLAMVETAASKGDDAAAAFESNKPDRAKLELIAPHEPGAGVALRITSSEEAFAKAFGTLEQGVANMMIQQLIGLLHPDGSKPLSDETVDLVTALLTELEPKDVTECLLVSQMIAAHVGSMETARRGLRPNEAAAAVQTYLGLSGKLMRTFAGQLETLNRSRGKGTVQRVVVEKVNVEAGGQAVVGAVAGGGARGS
ncbi:MAG: hypothetical protein FJX53_02430 [Alphaproteobacteria bacterium]|nr:hypothetical protein [Alphaproteobacteria bacterium]